MQQMAKQKEAARQRAGPGDTVDFLGADRCFFFGGSALTGASLFAAPVLAAFASTGDGILSRRPPRCWLRLITPRVVGCPRSLSFLWVRGIGECT